MTVAQHFCKYKYLKLDCPQSWLLLHSCESPTKFHTAPNPYIHISHSIHNVSNKYNRPSSLRLIVSAPNNLAQRRFLPYTYLTQLIQHLPVHHLHTQRGQPSTSIGLFQFRRQPRYQRYLRCRFSRQSWCSPSLQKL